MKVTRGKRCFTPITIEIETIEELKSMLRLLSISEGSDGLLIHETYRKLGKFLTEYEED